MIAVLASLHFAENFATLMQPPFRMEDFAFGDVVTPFRRRVLMQWLYRLFLHVGHGKTLRFHLTAYTPAQQFVLLTASVSLLLVIGFTLRLLRHLGGSRWFALLPLYLLAYNELLITEIRLAYPYNPPAVFFFTLGLAGVLLRSRALLYVALIVGTLNRETTLFLPLLFLLVSLPVEVPFTRAIRQVRLVTLLEVAAQLALWQLIVRLCESITGGHGAGMEIHWKHNLQLLVNPIHWPLYASVFGFLWLPLFVYWRRIDDVRLRRCLLILPLWAATMFVVGDILEIRLYSELAPLVALCLCSIASNKDSLRDFVRSNQNVVLPAT